MVPACPAAGHTAVTVPCDRRVTGVSLQLRGMEATIEVDGLSKRFGATPTLNGMAFTVLPGQVTGFVGPNGAGNPVTELRRSSARPGVAHSRVDQARHA